MSGKALIRHGLPILLVLMLVGSGALALYFDNLPQRISQHETVVLGQNRLVPGSTAGKEGGAMATMKKRKKEALGELRMDSTADVAFLLLIFFIVTTIFAAEQGLTLVLPGKQKEKTDTVKVKESNIATLFVQVDNTITLDRKPIEVNHIKRAIEDRILANPKLVVVLKIHPDANYGMMVSCLDELKQANANKVSLKTAES